jgi:hypothetical protein
VTVLDILLHHPLLPAEGHIATVRIKKVIAAHPGEASVYESPVALLDLVHGRLHVVVDVAPG